MDKTGVDLTNTDWLNAENLDVDRYITEKTMDALFVKLAEEEKLIRKDPVARSTDLLKKVFGNLLK